MDFMIIKGKNNVKNEFFIRKNKKTPQWLLLI